MWARARASERRARTQREELAQQIELEVRQSLEQLETSASSLRTATARAEAARAAFRIASRKRDEGVINQVEFMWLYEGFRDRDRRRTAMANDPQWAEFGKVVAGLGALKQQTVMALKPSAVSVVK